MLRGPDPAVPLDDMKFFRVRHAVREPTLVIQADGVDDKRVSFPFADRVALPRRIYILLMLSYIQKNLPELRFIFPQLH